MEKIIPTLKNTKRLILPLILGFFIIAIDSCIIVSPRPGHHKKGVKKKGPPPWAPAHGRRGKKRFVSVPTIDTFHVLSNSTYTFPDGYTWGTANMLPSVCANYNVDGMTHPPSGKTTIILCHHLPKHNASCYNN